MITAGKLFTLTRRLNPLSFQSCSILAKNKDKVKTDSFPVTFNVDSNNNGQGRLFASLQLSISALERQSRVPVFIY